MPPTPKKGEKKAEKPLQAFRVKAGVHVGDDPDKEQLPDGTFQQKQYGVGEVVWSTSDLAAKFGTQKFEKLVQKGGKSEEGRYTGGRLETDPAQELEESGAAVAPHGQVSTGLPKSVPGEGPVRQAIMKRSEAPKGKPESQPSQDEPETGEENAGFANSVESTEDQEEGEETEGNESQGNAAEESDSKEGFFAKLDEMTVSELRALAAKEKIDLKNATRKEDVVKTIKAAY